MARTTSKPKRKASAKTKGKVALGLKAINRRMESRRIPKAVKAKQYGPQFMYKARISKGKVSTRK